MAKQKIETESEEFRAAKATYISARSAWDALEKRLAGIKAARAWYEATLEERQSDRFDWCRRAITAAFGDLGPPPPGRLNELQIQTHKEMEIAHPIWIEAGLAYEQARKRETTRVAKSLLPRQRAIVERLGK